MGVDLGEKQDGFERIEVAFEKVGLDLGMHWNVGRGGLLICVY